MVVFSAAKSSITLECLLRHPFGTEILMAEVVFEQWTRWENFVTSVMKIEDNVRANVILFYGSVWKYFIS